MRSRSVRAAIGIVVTLGIAYAIGRPPAATPDDAISPTLADTAASLIRADGYNCPAAKLAYGKGEEARGEAMKVWCGPADRDGVFQNLAYRITVRSDGQGWTVRPW